MMTFEQRLDILHRLRRARALVLADSEAFVEAATVLEYVGQVSSGRVEHGLGKYKDAIVALARETGRFEKVKDRRELECVFDVVRSARNSAAHTGSWARHHSFRLVELILILEEALMHGEPTMTESRDKTGESNSKFTQVKHLMVARPVTAFEWNTLGHIRTLMLEHSFTYIPVKRSEGATPQWVLISDGWLMSVLRDAESRTGWNNNLKKTIAEALLPLKQHELTGLTAPICLESDPVASVVKRVSQRPLLVVAGEHSGEITGILTAFDLL